MSDDEDSTSEYEPVPVGELEATALAGPIEIDPDPDAEPVPDSLDEDPTNEFPVHRAASQSEPVTIPSTLAPKLEPRTLAPEPRTPEPGTPNYITRSPTASLVRMIRPNAAVILLGAVFLLAVIEIIAAFLAYRQQISDEDWDEVAALLEREDAQTLLIASEWLAPRARMELSQARSWDSVAPPDLRGMTRFWVLSFGRESWTPALRAELEDLPTPDLITIHTVGDLMLAEYQQDMAGERLWSLLERELEVESDAGRCSGKQDQWNCKDGRARTRVIEVDYRPRRCLALAFDDGVTATIDLGRVELGNRLRGHVGFGDFNARLRADPAVVLEAWIDEQLAARWVFTDDQGWAAFALATEPGTHQLELRVASTLAGTWQRDGHRPLPTDIACLEARALTEPEPAPEPEPEVQP
jgi:hypothetical protein